MNELATIFRWLPTVLKADASLYAIVGDRILGDEIPKAMAFPLVQFAYMSGRDVAGTGSVRLMTRPLFLVKVIVKGPLSSVAESAADRIDEVLQNVKYDQFGSFVFSARRETPVAYAQGGADAEQRYYHLGGNYRIDTQKA